MYLPANHVGFFLEGDEKHLELQMSGVGIESILLENGQWLIDSGNCVCFHEEDLLSCTFVNFATISGELRYSILGRSRILRPPFSGDLITGFKKYLLNKNHQFFFGEMGHSPPVGSGDRDVRGSVSAG